MIWDLDTMRKLNRTAAFRQETPMANRLARFVDRYGVPMGAWQNMGAVSHSEAAAAFVRLRGGVGRFQVQTREEGRSAVFNCTVEGSIEYDVKFSRED